MRTDVECFRRIGTRSTPHSEALVSSTGYFSGVPVLFMPFTRLYAYAMGMIVALEMPRAQLSCTATQSMNVWTATTLRVIAIAVTVMVALFSSVDSRNQPFAWYATQALLARPLFVIGIACVIYDLLLPRRPDVGDRYISAVTSLLASRPLYVVAQLSYTIYLFHPFFMASFPFLMHRAIASGAVMFDPRWLFPASAFVTLMTGGAFAVGVYYALEKPAVNLGR